MTDKKRGRSREQRSKERGGIRGGKRTAEGGGGRKRSMDRVERNEERMVGKELMGNKVGQIQIPSLGEIDGPECGWTH